MPAEVVTESSQLVDMDKDKMPPQNPPSLMIVSRLAKVPQNLCSFSSPSIVLLEKIFLIMPFSSS
jgi:hypothetical protein